jgi:putative FmdB family regulatory protein
VPTYEYACTQCGQHIEVFQRIAEDPLTTCGACGGPLRKVFHPAGILFKGSGFYSTDNRTKSKATTPPSGPAESAGRKESSTDASSDSGSGSGKSKSTAKEKSA